MKQLIALLFSSLVSIMFGAGLAQADAKKLVEDCEACHGEGGNGDDLNVPNIAGMSEAYFNDTMLAYRSGDRPGIKYKPKDGEETDMAVISKNLSEEDIAFLATHFSGQTYKQHPQQVDAALAAKGKELFDEACEKCHSEGGTVAEDDAGLIAGQGKPYLEQQFKFYSDGSRVMSKKMKKKYESLDDAGKAAVIEFLAGGSK